ncbi:hypothetical protein EK21DRAFT_115335 [Setomelanomma holmii]|uniref:Uncharacterized protein n=1 Tax=Setomelanomma holmii TaxID=210430 RepID=A0A9P4H2B3_9PLEO|nr:hypothetical protein EK21DRAFT_115335 [Setomelanomma holmii]
MASLSSSTTAPLIPSKTLYQILTYLDDPLYLWLRVRLMPHNLETSTMDVFKRHWIPKRTILTFRNPTARRGTFSHHFANGEVAFLTVDNKDINTIMQEKYLQQTWMNIMINRMPLGHVLCGIERGVGLQNNSFNVLFGTYENAQIARDTELVIDNDEGVVEIKWRELLDMIVEHVYDPSPEEFLS